MEPTRSAALTYQRRVDHHFDATARHWQELYEEPTLDGLIHQQRHAIALQWIDQLQLVPDAAVIDVGCGAGLLSVDIAARGYRVDAIDTSVEMVELAMAAAERAGLGQRVSVSVGDAHRLPFESESHQLLVALGVLMFLHSPEQALREFRRVLQPGGHVLLTSDNLYRLNHLLDPRFMPVLRPLRKRVRAAARRFGDDTVVPNRLSRRRLHRLLHDAGLTPVRETVLGFGPFSLLGRKLLPDSAGIRLHRRLQRYADAGVPGLRATGAQHIVVARAPLPDPPPASGTREI